MSDFGAVIVSGMGIQVSNNSAFGNSFVSEPVKGDGLVRRASGKHTLFIHTINFTGNITIEGTLAGNPNNGPWLPVNLIDTMSENTSTTLSYKFNTNNCHTETQEFYNIIGQYSWLRANISNFTYGLLDSIKLSI